MSTSTEDNNEMLTSGAVGTMVNAGMSKDLLVVRVSPLSDSECIIYDGIDQVKAAVATTALGHPYRDYTCIVAIQAYVVSRSTTGGCDPFLYLTNLEIVDAFLGRRVILPAGTGYYQLPLLRRVEGGFSFDFLKKWSPLLSIEDLSGVNAWGVSTFDRMARESKEKAITDFLSHHAAMTTLHRSNRSSSSAGPPSTINGRATENYMSALTEFETSQMDRQNASLTSNSGREVAGRAAKIVDQYREALTVALGYSNVLTSNTLCVWHRVLCGGGLQQEAGTLRRKAVRVVNTSFRPHQHVRGDLDEFCGALWNLQGRLLQSASSSSSSSSLGLAAVTFAAAAFYGIVDIHPFVDGNGRLGRIVVCWALKMAGLPFPVHLFATTAQRAEYTKAVIKTRRNIDLVTRGHVSQAEQLAAFAKSGCYAPLVDLILDRTFKSVTEFGKLVEEKSSLALEEAEAQAARKFRERSAAGSCMICFDEKPNIATLCCGKAVHLNCIAEWLSSRNSCPQCRAELPTLPPRMQAPAAAPSAVEAIDLDESSTTFSTSSDVQEDAAATTSFDDSDTSSTTDSTTISVTQQRSQPPREIAYCIQAHCRNRAALDCTNGCCGRCCVMHGLYACQRHS